METKVVELTTEQVVSKEQEVTKLMSMYQITRPEAEVQRAMYDLWYKHYTNDSLTIKERIAMTRTFKNEYANPEKIKLDKAFLRHPATRMKDFSRSCTIGEILGDFIMRIDQVAEREAEYPVHGVEKVFRDTVKDRNRIIGIYSQDEEDRDSAVESVQLRKYGLPKQTVMSAYDMSELSVVQQQSAVGARVIENGIDGEETMSIRKFKRALRMEKAKAKGYARLYANDGYDYDDALRRIRRLDVKRVRECNECGNVFYAHDNRRYICDLQHGRIQDKVTGEWRRSRQSHCEVENAKKRSQKQRESA